jgi:hypothetical protein
MKTTFSRRELYALGEPIGDGATRVKPGGHGRIYGMGGGGGGGNTTSTGTTYNTNIPEYAEPYVNTMLGATQKQLFNMSGDEITGFKPYNPYSKNASDYVAPFSPLQERAINTAASPEAFGREVSGYMSPYMQNVVDVQKREAMRGAGIMGAQQQAQATGSGAFGGYREGIQRAENTRNLGTQMNDIQLKGQQMAFDDATKQARANQQLQMQYGQMQQSQEQQKINQSIQDYANAQQYPLMQLGVMSNMLRGLPMQAATTNQYVAAPNPITQGIGLAGAGASIYNATKGASGGLPSEFKYAEGGIAAVPRYDVGGEVESQLESMDIPDLMKQAQESSSPTVRAMAKRILREKQMEQGAGQGAPQGVGPTGPMGVDYQAPQGMAGGGIIAFQQGKLVPAEDSIEGRQAARERDAAEQAEIAAKSNAATAKLIEEMQTGKYVPPPPAASSNEPVVATPVTSAGITTVPAAASSAPVTTDRAKGIVTTEPERAAAIPRSTDGVFTPAAERTGIKTTPDRVITARSPDGTGIKGAAPPSASLPGPDVSAEKAINAVVPAPVKPTMPEFKGPFADTQKALWEAQQEAKRTDEDFLKQVKEGQPENTAAAEYRKEIMAERANSKDEAERQRYMRMAQFFAKWGSTPGPTLAAGLVALEKTLPDIISDEQGYKKAKRELNKIVYDIDQATRLEELGNKKEARALKEKAADRALTLNHYLAQAQSSERNALIQQESSKYTADAHVRSAEINAQTARLDRAAARVTADDNKKFGQWQAATTQERGVLERIAFEENGAQHKDDVKTLATAAMLSAPEKEGGPPRPLDAMMAAKVKEAQERVTKREADWNTRRTTAQKNTDLAYSRVKVAEPAGGDSAPPPAAAPKTMSMADVEATAKSSGKSVEEVKAAAKAKGITIK